jgi:hypothetical protein
MLATGFVNVCSRMCIRQVSMVIVVLIDAQPKNR